MGSRKTGQFPIHLGRAGSDDKCRLVVELLAQVGETAHFPPIQRIDPRIGAPDAQHLAQVTDHLLKGLAGLQVEQYPLRQAGVVVVDNLDDFPLRAAAAGFAGTVR